MLLSLSIASWAARRTGRDGCRSASRRSAVGPAPAAHQTQAVHDLEPLDHIGRPPQRALDKRLLRLSLAASPTQTAPFSRAALAGVISPEAVTADSIAGSVAMLYRPLARRFQSDPCASSSPKRAPGDEPGNIHQLVLRFRDRLISSRLVRQTRFLSVPLREADGANAENKTERACPAQLATRLGRLGLAHAYVCCWH